MFASRTRMAGVKHGFTLIELLVVISIIALLVSILMPALGKARQAAQAGVCKSHMRQQAQLQFLYAADSEGRFPDHQDLLPNYAKSPEYDGLYSNKVHDAYKDIVQEPDFFICPLNVRFGRYYQDPSYTESWGNWWYGGWAAEYVSGVGNEPYQVIVMSYNWYANFIPGNEQNGKVLYFENEPKWPRRFSESTAKNALISHSLITGKGSQVYIYDRSHGGSDAVHGTTDFDVYSTSYESPVAYGDGHVATNNKGEIKLRAGYMANQSLTKIYY